jgi:D-tyrosyl-tRNA(Tyr) deacylase
VIGLLQRVGRANVQVAGQNVAGIERGILAMIAVERADAEAQADRLLERILNYRVFPDSVGRMNLSVRDIEGGVLLVPQFTLAADTAQGTRASFTPAAPAERGHELFVYLVARAREHYPRVGCGIFGADMQVALVNDGPVTFWLRS